MTTECSDGTKNNQLTVMSTNEPNLLFGMGGGGHHNSSCDSSYVRYNYMGVVCIMVDHVLFSLVFFLYFSID